MFTELLTALAAGLGAVVPVAIGFRKFIQEIEEIISTIGRISDEVRVRQELTTVRELCRRVRYLTAHKGDILDWIEWYIDTRAESSDAWADILVEFSILSDELEQIRIRLVSEPFSRNSFATEMAELASRAIRVFAEMTNLPAPKNEDEIVKLREIGSVVRQIQGAGQEALAKVDVYAEKLSRTFQK